MPQNPGQQLIPLSALDALPEAPRQTGPQAPASGTNSGGTMRSVVSGLENLGVGGVKSAVQTMGKLFGGDNPDAAPFRPFPDRPMMDTTADGTMQKAGGIVEQLAEILGGSKAIAGPIESGLVNLGLKGTAGNPLIMHAKTLADMAGSGAASVASGQMHDSNSPYLDAAFGAGGPLVGAGVETALRNPTGSGQILPYLLAILAGKVTGGGAEGLGSSLAGFGLTRMLAKQALRNPAAIPILANGANAITEGAGVVRRNLK